MKRNYWVGGFVTVVILFLNSPGFTQQTENDSNQGGVNESQPNYVIGLRRNAAPISYRGDDSDDSENFKGYCHAFIETLKTRISGNIKTVSVSRGKRFAGQGDNGEKLDALCGPHTITTGRETRELQENGLDGKFSNPFAWTRIAVVLKKKDKDNFLRPTLGQELKIGVINGTTTKEAVKALYPLLVNQIQYYNNFEEAIEKLENGEITAYFDDEILLKGKFQKNFSTNPNKEPEYEILPIPSVIEYGLVVFRTKENKNNKLLQAINILLENTQSKPLGGITIKILDNNKNFQDFINSVEQKKVEDSSRKPNPSPPVSSTLNLNWLLVFPIIIITIGVIIWFYFHIRTKSKPISPTHSQINIDDTLNLYHNQGVDPQAVAISFKQLAENHPDADLRIVGMEVREEDKFLLRAKTAPDADKSELSAEYFDNYNQIKDLPEREIKLLLAEKDTQIRRLENMVMTALERPSFYSNTQVEKVHNMHPNQGGINQNVSDSQIDGGLQAVKGDNNTQIQNQGDTTMTGDRTINTGGGNYNERIERDYIQGNYYAAGKPQSLAQAAAEIQLLLKQLEQTYPITTTSQQMVVAAEVINRIESNPTLKRRVVNAVKEGGLAAFEKAIDNPAGAFIVGAIKGWQEVEAED